MKHTLFALTVFLSASPSWATILKFENVKIPASKELHGLEFAKNYGDYVTSSSSGGFKDSFAKGNGWTPNIAIEFFAGPDLKTANTSRDSWDGRDGANYLLDGDLGGPYYYWYTFTPRVGVGVILNSLDLEGTGNNKNRIDWKIYAETKTGRVLASGSTGSFAGIKTKLNLLMKRPHFGRVVLELKHTGTRTSLAVDNLNFDEAASPLPYRQKVGKRKQLLVDDHVIASSKNLRRELGKVTKLNGGRPVMVRDQPWEKVCTYYGTALHDGKKFQLWYRASYSPWALGYAESIDGVNWKKPKLGLVEFGGTKQNNIVDTKLGLAYAFSCFIDKNEKDAKHKYKCCWGHPRKIRACIGYSADGIRWHPYNKGEPVTWRAADTHSQLLWDEDAKVYRLFTRTDYARFLRARMEVRGFRAMTNPDVKSNPLNWKLGRNGVLDRKPDTYKRRQVYSMTDWIHEGVHFGLITLFEYPGDRSEGPIDYKKRHDRDVLTFYLATSRDAVHWDFQWVYAGKPFVPRGKSGTFDKDEVIPPANIITHRDRHWIYYSGSTERHGDLKKKHGIGCATVKLDRLIGLSAGKTAGQFTTHPFVLAGDALEVNADTSAGSMDVEVLTSGGKRHPGYSATIARSDGLRLQPRFANDLSQLRGRAIRLRFKLKKAKIYAFQVK